MNLNSPLLAFTANTAMTWVFISSMLQTDIAVADQSAKRDLAKQLANPIADLYTLPLQFNFDTRVGTDNKGVGLSVECSTTDPFCTE